MNRDIKNLRQDIKNEIGENEKMDPTIAIELAPFNIYHTLIILGAYSLIANLIIGVMTLNFDPPYKLLNALLIFGLIAIIVGIAAGGLDQRQVQNMTEIETLEQNFKNKTFLIREMSQKDLLEGSGGMNGGFLLIAGVIHGEIQMAETQKITLIYRESNSPEHKIETFELEKLSIITIGKNEQPHFKYNNAYYETRDNLLTLKSGKPVLYLPEGWQIFGPN